MLLILRGNSFLLKGLSRLRAFFRKISAVCFDTALSRCENPTRRSQYGFFKSDAV
jgi:hypothetical protein